MLQRARSDSGIMLVVKDKTHASSKIHQTWSSASARSFICVSIFSLFWIASTCATLTEAELPEAPMSFPPLFCMHKQAKLQQETLISRYDTLADRKDWPRKFDHAYIMITVASFCSFACCSCCTRDSTCAAVRCATCARMPRSKQISCPSLTGLNMTDTDAK